MAKRKRNTTIRDNQRRTIARTKPNCWLCGETIDYSLHFLNPKAFVVDHKVPLSRGGTNTIDNAAAAHRDCNSAKAARPHSDTIRRSGALKQPNENPKRLD